MSDLFDFDNTTNIIPSSPLEHEMQSSFLDYAMSVITDRALPDARDGCKPVHRRILYVMSDVAPQAKPTVKSARIVGDVMGKYHPHGDSSIYEAMVRMAQDFSMGERLVFGQGNFGSRDGDGAAAMRYTEAKLTKLASLLMDDLDKDTVDWMPNFDGSLAEPRVLPAKFPNLLVNGGSGIAVGMATNIPTYNIREVMRGLVALLDNPELSDEELFQMIPGPDFPTGGIMMGRAGAHKAHATGRGSVIVRAKTHFEDFKDHTAIIVDEIPFAINKAAMVARIAELAKEKKIEGIGELRDESSREGMRVVIGLKRDAIPDVVLNQLYQYTDMQSSFPINMMALENGRPALFNVKKVLESFIKFRREIVRKRTIFELNKSRAKAHTLLGLTAAVGNLDEVIELIKSSDSPDTAKQKLLSKGWAAKDIENYIKLIEDPDCRYVESEGLLYMSEEQAKAILELQLHKLTGLEREKIHKDLVGLGGEIKRLLEILGSQNKITEIIRSESMEIIENFGRDRMTEISDAEFDMDMEDLIAEEDMVITITNTGYIKRVALDTYRAQKRGGKGRNAMTTKDEDYVADVFIANTHTPLMFFSSTGMCYRLKTYRLPEGGATAKGRPMINILPLSEGESITTILPVADSQSENYLMFVTKNGNVRRNKISDFESIRANGKIAMKLDDGDSLISVKIVNGEQDVLLSTHRGKVIRFAVNEIRVFAGRSSDGVRGISLAKDDRVIDMAVLDRGETDMEIKSAYMKLSRAKRRAETGVEEEPSEDEVQTTVVVSED
ncbi:MAG: DNA gyrase subunit A [Rickettsiales bacterium]|jgi:DNA gyrase subunit A|nr:DNA gyrase subunit A [Rickettsiales bacterium]